MKSNLAKPVTVVRRSEEFEEETMRVVQKYGIPVVSDYGETDARFGLEFHRDGLNLLELNNRRLRPISVRIGESGRISRKTLLGRAVGKTTKTVIDSTAGLGGDAFLMARMGFEVLAVERSPVIAALLEDGISRARKSTRLAITHVYGDSSILLSELDEPPDVVFMDPMYPQGRKRSVKVSRRLEVTREMAGEDSDAEELLKIALQISRKRVVVKRPNYASPLRPGQVSFNLKGKLVRYDIYLTAG